MRFLLLWIVIWAGAGLDTAHAETDWPEQVVRMEDMRLQKPLRISVPRLRSRGDVRGPVVLRVHVGADGHVRRVALLESCGSPDHDEASLHALREARFRPVKVNDQEVDVTLLLPLHLPLDKSR